MDNPFLKRATEVLHDDAAFLSVVSAEPIRYFLRRPIELGVLYDRLVRFLGTPGSGKTTLARVFTFPTLTALLRNRNISAYDTLVGTLTESRAIDSENPMVLGCRLPMESEYRDLWNFPYPDDLKLSLTIGLIQARAVLAWFRHLDSAGTPPNQVRIVPKADASAALEAIGGTVGDSVVARARSVERAIYELIGKLVPPAAAELDRAMAGDYRPFDVIENLSATLISGASLTLRPLVILDDAQSLHPLQLSGVEQRLARRELRVARWLLMRLDILKSSEALNALAADDSQAPHPGMTARGDIHDVVLQSSLNDSRRQQRLAFRRMARDMSDRYLRKMPIFQDANIDQFADLLSTQQSPATAAQIKKISQRVDEVQRKLNITADRRKAIEDEVASYHPNGVPLLEDIRLEMTSILMHRYAKRTPSRDLFSPSVDPEPARPLKADSDVADAAAIHLMHDFGRPYYFGMDDLCDSSSENADLFLKLSAVLTEASATSLIRTKNAVLPASVQHSELRRGSARLFEGWDFPQSPAIRRLVNRIAERCVKETVSPNGWLGAGANAYGISQGDFETITDKYPALASLLHYALAYNALTVVPKYSCKGTEWCLFELGGISLLYHQLPLKRGGFLEGTADELARWGREATE